MENSTLKGYTEGKRDREVQHDTYLTSMHECMPEHMIKNKSETKDVVESHELPHPKATEYMEEKDDYHN